jgi:hypothetical protein
MTGPLFLPSLNERIRDLERAVGRVRHSLSLLQHQDSSYAQDHRALLAAYGEALAVFKRHRDAAVNSGPAVLDEPNGPLCPVCCRPSWPMSQNGRLWRCSKPECMVSSFVLSDKLPDWEASEALAAGQELEHLGASLKVQPVSLPQSYNVNGREVLSVAGVQALAREAFPDGIPPILPDLGTLEDPSNG